MIPICALSISLTVGLGGPRVVGLVDRTNSRAYFDDRVGSVLMSAKITKSRIDSGLAKFKRDGVPGSHPDVQLFLKLQGTYQRSIDLFEGLGSYRSGTGPKDGLAVRGKTVDKDK